MALNSHIQKLCGDSLDELFSKENWEKIQRRKKIKLSVNFTEITF